MKIVDYGYFLRLIFTFFRRKLTRSDPEGESTTLYTIRFDKLPSTLLVPWDRQKKEILDLVSQFGTTVDLAPDAIENERQDQRATLFLRL